VAAHGYLLLLLIDAFEALGALAARQRRWADAACLLASGERLRGETGYRFRFAFEQQAVDDAWRDIRRHDPSQDRHDAMPRRAAVDLAQRAHANS
jgi:hypothetical protein